MNIVEDIKRLSIEIKETIKEKDITIEENRQSLIEVRDLLKGLLNDDENTHTDDTVENVQGSINEDSSQEI